MKKKAFIQLLCLPTFLHLRIRPKVCQFSSAMRRRIRFFSCCGNTSWTKILSNLRRKQIFVIFNDCQDMLKNVDEIIGRPFPVNGVFNQRSRRLCSGAQKVVGAGIASGTASETLCIIVILIIITDLSEAISQYLFK